MEDRQLKVFVEVLQTRSISSAADKLKVSQSAISQQIQKLEEKVGEQLLIRRSRGVELTSAGKVFLPYAERILNEQKGLSLEFERRKNINSGVIQFGVIPTMAPYLIPKLLKPYTERHDSVDFIIQEKRTMDLVNALVIADIDFAILSDVSDEVLSKYGLEKEVLFYEPLLLAVPKESKDSKIGVDLTLEDVDLRDIESQHFIHLNEGHCLRSQSLAVCKMRPEEVKFQCEQLNTALCMVEEGMGVCIVPKLAVSENCRDKILFKKIRNEEAKREISLLKRKNTQLPSNSQALISFIR